MVLEGGGAGLQHEAKGTKKRGGHQEKQNNGLDGQVRTMPFLEKATGIQDWRERRAIFQSKLIEDSTVLFAH